MAMAGSLAIDPSLAVVQRRIDMGDFGDDTLELWAEAESRVRAKAFEGVSTAAPLDRALRRAIVAWIDQTLQYVGASPSDAGQAVAAFDMYCQRTTDGEGAPLIARLPGACAAICSLVCKLNGCKVLPSGLQHVLDFQSHRFGLMLKDIGLLPKEGVVDVSQQEVLEALRWSLGDMIPAEWWLSAFCERLNDASNGKLRQRLGSCRPGVGAYMRKMTAEATVFELSPRKLAEGTFFMMLKLTVPWVDAREMAADCFGLPGDGETLRKCMGLAAMTDFLTLAESDSMVSRQLNSCATKLIGMTGGAPEEPVKKEAASVDSMPSKPATLESPQMTASPAIDI